MSEADIALLFEQARSEIDNINKQAQGGKKRIIEQLAKDLERYLPLYQIAEEIKHQLKGWVNPSWVDKILDSNYKNPERAESGRRGAKSRKISLTSQANSTKTAESASREAENPLMAITTGGQSVPLYNEEGDINATALWQQAAKEVQEEKETTQYADTSTFEGQVLNENFNLKARLKEARKEIEGLKSEIARLSEPWEYETALEIEDRIIPVIATARPDKRTVYLMLNTPKLRGA